MLWQNQKYFQYIKTLSHYYLEDNQKKNLGLQIEKRNKIINQEAAVSMVNPEDKERNLKIFFFLSLTCMLFLHPQDHAESQELTVKNSAMKDLRSEKQESTPQVTSQKSTNYLEIKSDWGRKEVLLMHVIFNEGT